LTIDRGCFIIILKIKIENSNLKEVIMNQKYSRTVLFIIDPQIDFCDSQGALFVPGADDDMLRLAAMIRHNRSRIEDIHVTLDSHHFVHVAHPVFWIDSHGRHPQPFSVIQRSDVKEGRWRSYNPGFQARAYAYVQSIEDSGRYVLTIWPPHCLIGSRGHAIVPQLFEAMLEWESEFNVVNIVTKGSNMFTEHYSAVRADVIDPDDPSTMLNTRLIDTLRRCDADTRILIAGEALSHCVANTIRDVANEFSEAEVKKFVILEDASSSVPGFEALGQKFLADMIAKGVQIATTKSFFA
jgi:nicotinamidase-related amidase